MTRTRFCGTCSTSATSRKCSITCVERRIVMTPSESIHATPDSGSRYAASTSCVVYSPSTTTFAPASAFATSPRAMRHWASRLPVPCTGGAPGASAASGVNTPGVTSYSTSIVSTASRASSSGSAATSLSRASWRTTGWPTTRSASRVATASVMAVLAADVSLDRVDDLRVARAAAEVAFQRGADRLAIGPRLALEEGQRRQQHAGRAEAALHGAVAHERLLQRVQATVALQPAQRDDGAASQPGGQNEARGHRPPVEQHRADAAHALVAALLDVEDAQRVAQQLEQRLVRAHLDLSRAPVEDEARDHVCPSARAPARASARPPTTPATWRRDAPA